MTPDGEPTMLERLAEALGDIPDRLYFVRRLMDKSAYEVILDTDPHGPITDTSFVRVFGPANQDDCEAECKDLIDMARVRAILETIKPPSKEMIVAGIVERHGSEVPEAWSLATANIFTAMIDAALGQQGD
jgi:hypothetical protein